MKQDAIIDTGGARMKAQATTNESVQEIESDLQWIQKVYGPKTWPVQSYIDIPILSLDRLRGIRFLPQGKA